MKPSYLLILIASASLLSGASESAEKQRSVNPAVAQKNTAKTQDDKNVEKRQPPQVVKTLPESAIVKGLSTFIEKQEAQYKEQRADEKRWWPPSASWAIVYVTIIYVFVAFSQWRAIVTSHLIGPSFRVVNPT